MTKRSRGIGPLFADESQAGMSGEEIEKQTATVGASDQWRHTIRRRITSVAVVLLVWMCVIGGRLWFLQVYQHDFYLAEAAIQQEQTLSVPAKRGAILDRKGRVLALSVEADTITAVPRQINNAEVVAKQLCDVLKDCGKGSYLSVEELTARLDTDRAFAYIRRQVLPTVKERIAALKIEGIGWIKEERRYYPNREMAAHLLGYVGLDNKGLGGIESKYQSTILGQPGKILFQTDARHRAFVSRIEQAPTVGATLELTIDENLQHIAERELRRGIEEHRASAGTVIILQPYTGEVLALANEPTFNPNAFRFSTSEVRRNRAIQDQYEPGSIFKIVTASAALEEKVVAPDDLFDVSEGMIHFGARTIHDTTNYGTLSFTDVIVKSSNVGTILVGQEIGADRLDEYTRRFGFGRRLSQDFSGENPGFVWPPENLDPSALASVSIGYQIGVTPLQMAVATSVIANGGNLMEPHVVKALVAHGRRVKMKREDPQRVITRATATTVTSMMEDVVRRGTATRAQIPGYTIAGKTGTAAKFVNGAYSKSLYNSSFVGFTPSRAPELTILVVIDSPKAGHTYGGVVAAPIFKRIAEAALRYLEISPTLHAPSPILVPQNSAPESRTAGARQRPAAMTAIATVKPGQVVMPDLRGLSARQALRALAKLEVRAHLEGNGFVVEQTPEPGIPIDRDFEYVLRLDRNVLTPRASTSEASP